MQTQALVKKAIASRNALPSNSPWQPSKFWQETSQYLSFLLDMPPHLLLDVRLHTGFLTGQPWYTHIHNPYSLFTEDSDKETIPLIAGYKHLTQEIPECYWASEPSQRPTHEKLGVWYRGRQVTDDVLRYQYCITNLYNLGFFRDIHDAKENKATIVEIGGGYGGLAHQILRTHPGRFKYVILDLPEILFWAYTFLTVNNPDLIVHFCEDEQSECFFDPLNEEYATADIILMPNYLLPNLKVFPQHSLQLNLLSFQEMSNEQIGGYCTALSGCLNGLLYSDNFRRHWMNRELITTVGRALTDYYYLFPTDEDYDAYNDEQVAQGIQRFFVQAGISRKFPVSIRHLRPLMEGSGYRVMLEKPPSGSLVPAVHLIHD